MGIKHIHRIQKVYHTAQLSPGKWLSALCVHKANKIWISGAGGKKMWTGDGRVSRDWWQVTTSWLSLWPGWTHWDWTGMSGMKVAYLQAAAGLPATQLALPTDCFRGRLVPCGNYPLPRESGSICVISPGACLHSLPAYFSIFPGELTSPLNQMVRKSDASS